MMKKEKRLIAFDDIFPNYCFYINNKDPMKSLDELINRIINAPSVDAIKVVRCKFCDWYRGNVGICVNPKCTKSWYGCRVPPNHFCSYGERKDNV